MNFQHEQVIRSMITSCLTLVMYTMLLITA